MLIGDFNRDLLHYETHNQSKDFLDKMLSASSKPYITTHTQITHQSKTLFDNIFIDIDISCGIKNWIIYIFIYNIRKITSEMSKPLIKKV